MLFMTKLGSLLIHILCTYQQVTQHDTLCVKFNIDYLSIKRPREAYSMHVILVWLTCLNTQDRLNMIYHKIKLGMTHKVVLA